MAISRRIIPPTPPGWNTWEDLMCLALAEARLAGLESEIPVGAVLVSQNGDILGKGRNSCIKGADPTAHAEINAIRNAGERSKNYRLEKTFLIVTLEPCLMCCGAIVHARIAGVVFGAPDQKAGAVSSCLEGFALPFINHAPWFLGNILQQECSVVLSNFFEERR